MTGVSISGVGHCGNFQPGTAIESFALSRNHALAIEEICNLALSIFFKKLVNFGNDCRPQRLFDRFFKGAIAPSREFVTSALMDVDPSNRLAADSTEPSDGERARAINRIWHAPDAIPIASLSSLCWLQAACLDNLTL
jgi:hypothetical protein